MSKETISLQASRWVVRMERGLTAAEQDEFLDWLARDPRHGDELGRKTARWKGLDLLADWRPEHDREPNQDILAPSPEKIREVSRRQFVRFAGWGFAAAAVLAVAFFSINRRPASAEPANVPRIALIETQTLPDGSVLALNRGAKVRLHFTERTRGVELEQGEARFEVAKDPARPFVVKAGGVEFQAIGTAFNVTLAEARVRLVVTEGVVQVASSAEGKRATVARVEAGHQTELPLGRPEAPKVTEATAEAISSATVWQPTLLDFTDTPLSAVAAEFNRRNAPIQVVTGDPELAATTVNASLRSDNVEGFLRMVESGFDVRVERSGNLVILRRTDRR